MAGQADMTALSSLLSPDQPELVRVSKREVHLRVLLAFWFRQRLRAFEVRPETVGVGDIHIFLLGVLVSFAGDKTHRARDLFMTLAPFDGCTSSSCNFEQVIRSQLAGQPVWEILRSYEEGGALDVVVDETFDAWIDEQVEKHGAWHRIYDTSFG